MGHWTPLEDLSAAELTSGSIAELPTAIAVALINRRRFMAVFGSLQALTTSSIVGSQWAALNIFSVCLIMIEMKHKIPLIVSGTAHRTVARRAAAPPRFLSILVSLLLLLPALAG